MADSKMLKSIAQIVQRLLPSKNVCDMRKARDLELLQQAAEEPWSGRCIVDGIGAGERGAIFIAMHLQNVAGLILRDGQPLLQENWDLHIGVHAHYPYSKPEVKFQASTIPFNPHVLHKESHIDEESLPRELLEFLEDIRKGQEGFMCYSANWPPLATHDLTLLVWQISRILGGRVFGEKYSLNDEGRDYYLRLGREGRLPLGPPLPLLCALEDQDLPGEEAEGEDDAIELCEIEEQ